MSGGKKLLLLLPAAGILAGCTSVPERELENAFKHQRLKRSDHIAALPVTSVYQELAQKAVQIHKQGGTAEYVSMLEVGDEALLARVHLIRSATKSIDVQTFIRKDDPTSRFLFGELVKAAERGVLVQMLIDALNPPLTPRDPTFQDNYTDVGYFPEVPDSSTVIETRLTKAFGGWTRSFM